MITRDIIVVGASAGGVTALMDFVSHLSKDFKGSVFVVLHIPAYTQTSLHLILSKAGPLEAVLAKDGEKIECGKIYVANNDHHLLLDGNTVVVKKGPKENRFRPSIDALFRSAAYIYGPRVIGIVLSGVLNDGTSGLWSIKRLGGIAIIQEPEDAEQPQMPLNVLEYTEADYSVPAIALGALVNNLVKEPAGEKTLLLPEESKLLKTEVIIARGGNAFKMGIMNMGALTPFTCPECHGVLVRLFEGKIVRFRCHTGHAYTASSLLADLSQSVEEHLWQSMRAMEEMSLLLNEISKHFEKTDNKTAVALFSSKAEFNSRQAQLIHDTIFTQEQYSEDFRLEPDHVL